MSGTFPTSPAPAAVTIRSLQPTLVSVAHSLQRQARSRGGQRWGFKLAWPNMRRADFAPLLAFALAQRGQFETFTLALPNLSTPLGTWAGTPVVDGAGQSGRSVNLRGFTAGATVKAGDFVKFFGHDKVYMATADAMAGGPGTIALAIEPALLAAPADGAAVTADGVAFTCAFAGDMHETTFAPGMFCTFEADLVEVVT